VIVQIRELTSCTWAKSGVFGLIWIGGLLLCLMGTAARVFQKWPKRLRFGGLKVAKLTGVV